MCSVSFRISSGASNSIVSSIICFCFCFFVFCSRLALVLYVVCRCCNKVSLKKKKKKKKKNTICLQGFQKILTTQSLVKHSCTHCYISFAL